MYKRQVPTPQLNLDSFDVWGNAVSAAVKAVDPATPEPRFLMFDLLLSICPWILTPFIWRSEP